MDDCDRVKWREVIEIKNGRNQKAVEDINGQYPIYGSGGIMGFANNYLCQENTVIIGRKGSINKPIYVTEKFWNVDTAFGLNTKPDRLFSKYLYYFCISFDFEKLNTTVTIPSLTKSNLLNIEIPLPPLETQKQIAKILDAAAEILSMLKQQLAELDDLIKSIFYDMFGDPVTNEKGCKTKKLGDFATLLNGRAYKQVELLKEGKMPVLRVGNFFSNRGWYFSDLELEVNKYCDKGDLLYAWSASFGPKIWDGPKSIYHYHIWKIVLNDGVDKQFVFSLLKYTTEKLKEGTHGIAMMHLTKSGMEQTEFIVPELFL